MKRRRTRRAQRNEWLVQLPAQGLGPQARCMADTVDWTEHGIASSNQRVDPVNILLHAPVVVH